MCAVIKVRVCSERECESVCIISAVMVVVVRGGGGGGGGQTQRDRRQPWFGAEPEEGLWLTESRATGGARGEEEEEERIWGCSNAEM